MIVTNAIAPALEEELMKQCKTGPFSFGYDESDDTNQQKILAIVVKDDCDKFGKNFFNHNY